MAKERTSPLSKLYSKLTSNASVPSRRQLNQPRLPRMIVIWGRANTEIKRALGRKSEAREARRTKKGEVDPMRPED